MNRKALIIGVSSQDGSYLADLLVEKGYEVIGTLRRTTSFERENIAHLARKIRIEPADLVDFESIARLVREFKPQEIYNLAAQSVPADSWSHPFYTAEVTGIGPVRVMEAIRKFSPKSRMYQATSREIYGNIEADFANENTKPDANNPYGIAKAYAHMMARCYRESYGLFICSGILFNHESPRRSLHFVTRKITAAAACIKNKSKHIPLDEAGKPLVREDGKLHLGFLGAKRDWGYAKEYVEAMYLMLQLKKASDYVIGAGTENTVADICALAFGHVGLNWEKYVVSDEDFKRPTEIKGLKADYSKARKDLGWKPRTSLKKLIELMVDADLKRFTE